MSFTDGTPIPNWRGYEKDIKDNVLAYKAVGMKIAFTNGCFDLFHAGHLQLLKFCARGGRKVLVVVGVNSDDSVRRLKGDDRPIIPFDQRVAIVASCVYVTQVVGFDEATPEELITWIEPDVLIKGEEWMNKKVAGSKAVIDNGGFIKFSPMAVDVSTSKIIEKIRGLNG